ncbi:putative diguanylate cyclase YdaM [mine drainage metagenome]|uniref:Putative diguanylate cyclase YdaM n=1 Tax=mine drainage metagenome TaxID=410659 RepID=A0A1J5RNH7_9ZZZZ
MPPRTLLVDADPAALTSLAHPGGDWWAALEAAGDGAWAWDLDSGLMACSRCWLQDCGFAGEDRGAAGLLWRERIHPDDREAVAAEIAAFCAGERDTFRSEHRLAAAGGYRPVLMRGAVLRRSAAGLPAVLAGTFTDLSGYRRLEETVRQLSASDPLTGLRTRRAFLEAAEGERRRVRRHGGALSLILADLDGFRRFNDAFGPQTGDAALCRVARCLEATLRKTDTVGRLGGGEFAVLLPATEGARAGMVAESLRQAIADSSVPGPGGGSVRITASFGVACLAAQEDGVAELLRRTGAALCDAKRLGRNRVCRPAP